MKKIKLLLCIMLGVCLIFGGCDININLNGGDTSTVSNTVSNTEGGYTVDNIPDFVDEAFVEINNNVPYFTEKDYTTKSFEQYGDLDSLGRCTIAYACVAQDTMPTDKRGSISNVKPSGWQTVKYDNVDGKYLYNRCHLIGWQLTAENANKSNLITGTRYLNIEGMLPFENMVADYVKETNNHVLYRVTPIFDGDNLVARGVEMEGYSVEDNGAGISFNIYAYNVQPDIEIDYATGESWLSGTAKPTAEKITYILNTNNHKFHLESCSVAKTISDKNKEVFTGTREEVIAKGYEPCGKCKP